MHEDSQPVVTALERGPAGDLRELAARYLEEYLAKIRACLARLSDQDVWQRSHPATNSIANLLLHLRGNLSLWILHGLGGEPDTRRRSLEFSTRESASLAELEAGLTEVLGRCCSLVRGLDPSALGETREIQGYSVDGLGVLFHAVEHMSYHTGQIVSMTKAQGGDALRLEFYPRHGNE